MAAFEYRQAQEIRDIFSERGVRYLFIGKSGAILLGFELTDGQAADIIRGKDFVQLKNGPFDLDLIFAPDGIERFEDAWRRHVDVEGLPVCHIDDIIARSLRTGKKIGNRFPG